MEIITGVERRRQWRDEEKLRILAELNEPGVKFSEVARRHDISRGLLWQWRGGQRAGRVGGGRRGVLAVEGRGGGGAPGFPAVAGRAGGGCTGPARRIGPAALCWPCRSGGRAGRAHRD